jgi:hypothetical protein
MNGITHVKFDHVIVPIEYYLKSLRRIRSIIRAHKDEFGGRRFIGDFDMAIYDRYFEVYQQFIEKIFVDGKGHECTTYDILSEKIISIIYLFNFAGYELEKYGAEDSHTLTIDEIPNNTHGQYSDKNAMHILKEMQKTYTEKNKQYGNSFFKVGNVMSAMFPNGLTLKNSEDFTRLHLLEWTIGKICRYANNFMAGGHKDSAHDAGIYLAILQFVDEQYKEQKA